MKYDVFKQSVDNAITALNGLVDDCYVVETTNTNTWYEKYMKLEREINAYLHNAEQLYEDMKAHGLTVNTIEAEGFLRGARHMYHIINSIEVEGED